MTHTHAHAHTHTHTHTHSRGTEARDAGLAAGWHPGLHLVYGSLRVIQGDAVRD
jgi:hypothetical protein